jgi:hypothetical protein
VFTRKAGIKSYTIKLGTEIIATIIDNSYVTMVTESLINTNTSQIISITSNAELTSGVYRYSGTFTDGVNNMSFNVNFVIYQFVLPPEPLAQDKIAEIVNIVPIVSIPSIIESTTVISVPPPPVGLLSTGTTVEKSQKRTQYITSLFTSNAGLETTTGKVVISKAEFLGSDSVITASTVVIKKSSNTEVPQNTAELGEDEAIYMYMDTGDFTVFDTTVGKLKIKKQTDTLYAIYEGYVDSNTPITKTMNVGDSSSYGTFRYVVGSATGNIDPTLQPPTSTTSAAPICFPAGTPVNTNQGLVAIEKLNPDIHTIRNKRIVAITQTRPLFTHIVSIEKDALGKNVPTSTTQISKEHGVFYKGKMMRAIDLVNVCKGVTKIPYTGGRVLTSVVKRETTQTAS